MAASPRLPPVDAPLDGTKYCLIAPLGSGGMGQVWLAEHVALKAEVVVKLLDPSLAERRDLKDRLRLEAQALAQLRHPNIVAVIDAGHTEAGHAYLVMERLRGNPLSAELRARRFFGAAEALALGAQVLAGLAAAHSAGIVHRDVKPSNLILCDGPEPTAPPLLKLIDFGIAKVVGEGEDGTRVRPLAFPTEEGEVLGTPAALSPEQALARRIDQRTDLYAVGLLLYRLLTGEHPFARLHGAELIRAYTTLSPEPPSRRASQPIAPELDALVLRALRADPADRFSSATEFLKELRRVEQLGRAELTGVRVMPTIPVGTLEAPVARAVSEPLVPAELASTTRTEQLSVGELSALDAVLGSTERAAPSIATDALPATRTAAIPRGAGMWGGARLIDHGKFVAVAGATALAVVTILELLIGR